MQQLQKSKTRSWVSSPSFQEHSERTNTLFLLKGILTNP